MSMKLLISALTKYLAGLFLVGLILFLPAGTLNYPGGWLFCGLLFVPMLILGIVLWRKAPALLEKRLRSKEKLSAQKSVIGLSLLMFVGGFALAGLDFRFGWTTVPGWLVVTAACLLLLSYGLYAEVMRENAWLSRTVEVQEGQQVVDSGLYGIVRHPMYAVTTVLFLSIPLVLGSWIAFVVFLIYPALMVKRIRSEEQLLEAELPGYADYQKKVKYRMIPFLW
ncbi:MAG: isoprenylcysteine carboxylmethyltransferase family protein [Oscillospiraceae bacterium]|nr:isoprenylcysteine carboxylmethyltransferase family protein [Oscillospiraceae bacterium]